ncbi:MAG: hypothetical protein KGI97_06105 [Alphaproteobacteria bacterium]|nr:hypothetical protein [Alphaproteobacteria bacterium]
MKSKSPRQAFDFELSAFGHSEGEAFQEICPTAKQGDVLVVHAEGPRARKRHLVHLSMKPGDGVEHRAIEAVIAEWENVARHHYAPDARSAVNVFIVPLDGVRGALRGGVYNIDMARAHDRARLRRALVSAYRRLAAPRAETAFHVRDMVFAG